MKFLFFASTLFVMGSLILGCGQKNTTGSSINTSNRYWNVVMAGSSTAAITFSQPLSSSGMGIITGGSSAYTTSWYNLYISGGGTTCQVMTAGLSTVQPGAASGTITFNNVCVNQMTSNLVISLGNSITGVVDSSNNYVVAPGKSVSGTIIAPGATGASTGNISY